MTVGPNPTSGAPCRQMFGKLVCHVGFSSWAVGYTDCNWLGAPSIPFSSLSTCFPTLSRAQACWEDVLGHDHREGPGCNGQLCSAFPSKCLPPPGVSYCEALDKQRFLVWTKRGCA